MSETSTDLIQFIFDQAQISFSAIDSTATDVEIQEFLEDPTNGYMQVEEEVWVEDTTSFELTVVDTTSPTITVLAWKEENLEDYYNQSQLQNDQISIRDYNSPNYPIIDFKSLLFDFDTSTSMDYAITPDSTADNFIQYELPASEKVDGMYIQLGLNGVQTWPVVGGGAFIGYYIAFSNDSLSWTYITNDLPMDSTSSQTNPIITTDLQTAIDNHFFTGQPTDAILPQVVEDIMFTDTAIEAKYWRIHFVDIEENVDGYGIGAGYTGYTASVSHLRFEQIREHGEAVLNLSLDLSKLKGAYASGDSAGTTGNSGSGWFTTVEQDFYFTGHREALFTTTARVWADASTDFRIRVNNEGGGWTVMDTVTGLSGGYATLTDTRILLNPNADVNDVWTVQLDLQDQAAAGTPNVEYRASFSTNYRSSEEVEPGA